MSKGKIDYRGLDSMIESGVRAKPETPHHAFNATCPDWCSTIGGHVIDNTLGLPVHQGEALLVAQELVRGYESESSDDTFKAHFQLSLRRGDQLPLEIALIHVWGDEDYVRHHEYLGSLTMEEARKMILVLGRLIEVGEDVESLG